MSNYSNPRSTSNLLRQAIRLKRLDCDLAQWQRKRRALRAALSKGSRTTLAGASSERFSPKAVAWLRVPPTALRLKHLPKLYRVAGVALALAIGGSHRVHW